MKYTEKEVVELFNEYHKWTHLVTNVNEFLKEKGLIKEEFEVGKWYKHTANNHEGLVFCVNKNKYVGGYGFNSSGFWEDCISFSKDWLTPATDKEFETALIKEAKKRGFKEGVKFLSARDGDIRTATNEFYSFDNWNKYTTLQLDTAWIFKGGKWATIIEEPKVKEMTMQEVNKALGYEIKIKE